MFSLVLAVIAIAFAVALFAISHFYGGSQLTESQATAEAVRLRSEDQQIMAAFDMFNADKGRFPLDLQELVAERYLLSVPRGAKSAPEVKAEARMARAGVAPAVSGWSTPVPGTPIILTETTVPREVCRKYNLAARGDDGILKQVMEGLQAQCYGREAVYRVVVSKGSLPALIEAVDPDEVLTGGVPATSTGDIWWDTLPSGAVLVEVDPDKVPYAKLALSSGSTERFGALQVGQTKTSSARTLTNTGNIPANTAAISAPDGFSLASNSCAGALQPGASCSFTVKFAPITASSYTGSLSVASSNAGAVDFAVSGEGQAASASLADVSFGNLAAGARRTQTAALANTGIGPLTLGNPQVTGAGFALAGSTCSGTLPAGSSCTVDVELAADGLRDHEGTLTVPTYEAGAFRSSLTGYSQQAVLSVSPAVHSMGSVQVGQVQESASSTLRNTGNIPLEGLTIEVASPFSRAASNCGAALAPGASCEVGFRFSPQADGAARENAAVRASNAPTQTIELTGLGVAQAAALSGGAFGSVASGSSVDQVATLTNIGVGPLALTVPSAASVTGTEFSFLSTTCGTSLAAGQSCTVSMRYSATGVAAAAGVLTVSTGAGAKSLTLSGQSQQGVLAVTPKTDAFGTVQIGQTAASGAHTLTNNGNLGIAGLTLKAPAGFALATNGCSATLAPAASCSFTVSFTPASAVSYDANLSITASNAAGTTVALTGAGQAPSASLAALAFGSHAAMSVVDRTTTLTNTGVAAISVTTPAASSVTGVGFSYLNTTCGTTLAAGANCSITVRYAATAANAASGTLTVTTGAGVKTAALTAQSLASVATVTSAASITLADWYQSGSITGGFTIRNNGNQAFTLTAMGLSGALSVASNTCSNVAPGQQCEVRAALNRASTGGSGIQTITMVGATQGSLGLQVNWAVHTAIPRWSATSLPFGNVTVGQAVSTTIYLYNDGSVAYNWTAGVANLPAGFSFNMSACSNVAPGGYCPVTVTFAPGGAGPYGGGSIVVPAYSYYSNLLSVIGAGVSANVSAGQFSVSTPNGGGDDFWVTITNNSGQNVTVVAVEFVGTYDEYVYANIGGRQYGYTYNSYDWCCRFDGAATWAAGARATVYYDIQYGYTAMQVTLSNGQVLAFYIPQAG